MSERAGTATDARAGTTPLAPQSEAPKLVRCLNCDSPMAQQFCPACGQAATDPDPTLREFLNELAAEFFLWDGKLLTTFRLLVTNQRQFGRRVGNALRHKEAFADAMRENTPRMMFVLVPLFAALTALVFRSRRMHYPKHLTFALHAHAFLFLALIPTLAPRILPRTNVGGLISAIVVFASFGAIATYLVLALRRVYGGTLRGAIARSALLAGSYFVLFTIALLTTVAIVMAVQF